MKYRKIDSFKYEMMSDRVFLTPINPSSICRLGDKFKPDVTLDPSGMLVCYAGYKWDGASGPTWDDKTNLEPSLAHDAFYHLMRAGLLDRKWRKAVDKFFYNHLLAVGMPKWRAWYYYWGVRIGGRGAVKGPDDRYKIYSC